MWVEIPEHVQNQIARTNAELDAEKEASRSYEKALKEFMTEVQDLFKYCPFCERAPVLQFHPPPREPDQRWSVSCGKHHVYRNSLMEALQAWNDTNFDKF